MANVLNHRLGSPAVPRFSKPLIRWTGLLSASLTLGLATGCLYDFSRDGALSPGEARGRTVVNASPSGFTRTAIDGASGVRFADTSGQFSHTDLSAGTFVLRAFQDENHDSWPERAALVSFNLVETAHAEGLFGTSAPVLSSVDLGDISLVGTVEIQGEVREEDGSPAVGAKVVVAREVQTQTLSGSVLVITGGVEAQVATDDAGRFRMAAVIPGSFSIIAIRESDEGVRVSPAFVVDSTGGQLELDEALVLGAGAVGTREVVVTVAPKPAAGTTLTVTLTAPAARGVAARTVEFSAADLDESNSLNIGAFGIGQYNVDLASSDGSRSAPERRFVFPGAGEQRWGAISLVEALCEVGTDCDGDGIRGLSLSQLGNEECKRTCIGGNETCVIAGEVFDCEDDGDGQIDVTEPECYGLGRGTDCDTDGVCDWEDDDPFCRPDDVDCDPTAVANNCGLELPDPEDAGPGPEDAGPVPEDAGPGPEDAGPGPEDAGPGPEDAGPGPEDGGLIVGDAGPTDAGGPSPEVDAGVDAGEPDPVPDEGFGIDLVDQTSTWRNYESIVPFGANVMGAITADGNPADAKPGFDGCPQESAIFFSSGGVVVHDENGACVQDFYFTAGLDGNGGALGIVREIRLVEDDTGAIALLFFEGELEVSPGVTVGEGRSPFDPAFAFVHIDTNGSLSVMSDIPISGNPYDLHAVRRTDGGIAVAFELSYNNFDIEGESFSAMYASDLVTLFFDGSASFQGVQHLVGTGEEYFTVHDVASGVGDEVFVSIYAEYGNADLFSDTLAIPTGVTGVIRLTLADGATGVTQFTDARSVVIDGDPTGGFVAAIAADRRGQVLSASGDIVLTSVANDFPSTLGNIPLSPARVVAIPGADFVVGAATSVLSSQTLLFRLFSDGTTEQIGLSPVPLDKLVYTENGFTVAHVFGVGGGSIVAFDPRVNADAVTVNTDAATTSSLAYDPGSFDLIYSVGRGVTGFNFERVSAPEVIAIGTDSDTRRLDDDSGAQVSVPGTSDPKIDVDELGNSIWFFGSDALTRVSLTTLAVSEAFATVGQLNVNDMDVVFGEDMVLLALSGNGPVVSQSPLTELNVQQFSQPYFTQGDLSSVQWLGAPTPTVDDETGTTAFTSEQPVYIVSVGSDGVVSETSAIGSAGEVDVGAIAVTPTRLHVIARVDPEGDGTDVTIATQTGPAVLRSPQDDGQPASQTGLISIARAPFGDVVRALQTNSHARVRPLEVITVNGDDDVVLTGETDGSVFLGSHLVTTSFVEDGGGTTWMWRPGDGESSPFNGAPESLQAVSLVSVGARPATYVSSDPVSGERLLAAQVNEGTLGAGLTCTHATSTGAAVLLAVLDESGTCVRSAALQRTGGTAGNFTFSRPLLLEDGRMRLAATSNAGLEVVSDQTTLIPGPSPGELAAVLIDVDVDGAATVRAEVQGTVDLGTSHLAQARDGSALWLVPFFDEVTFVHDGTSITVGESGAGSQFAVFEVTDTAVSLLWQSISVSGGGLYVDNLSFVADGVYAISIAGTGSIFNTTLNNNGHIVAVFETEPAGAPVPLSTVHFDQVYDALQLGNTSSRSVSVTGNFAGSFVMNPNGNSPVTVNGAGDSTAFDVRLDFYSGDPSGVVLLDNPASPPTMSTASNVRSGATAVVGGGTNNPNVILPGRGGPISATTLASMPFAVVTGGLGTRSLVSITSTTGSASTFPIDSAVAGDLGVWVVGDTFGPGTMRANGVGSVDVPLAAGDLWLWHIPRAAP